MPCKLQCSLTADWIPIAEPCFDKNLCFHILFSPFYMSEADTLALLAQRIPAAALHRKKFTKKTSNAYPLPPSEGGCSLYRRHLLCQQKIFSALQFTTPGDFGFGILCARMYIRGAGSCKLQSSPLWVLLLILAPLGVAFLLASFCTPCCPFTCINASQLVKKMSTNRLSDSPRMLRII